MDQASPEGVVAPVETVIAPTSAPDGPPVEAGKPAAVETPAASPEGQEPKGVAKRIKELTDARRAAEQREERLLRLLEQNNQPKPQPQAPAKPRTLQDFNYDENAYREHLYTEARTQAADAAKAEALKWRQEQEAIGRRAKFDERAASYAKANPEYQEAVSGQWACSESMAEVIEESDEGPALAFYLAQNPDVAATLAKLSPAKSGRELAKLEDELVRERKKAAEKSVSKAPPPAPKIEATAPGSSMKSTDPEAEKLPGDQWLKLREKELAAARKRKA
jgi:hypothetical protein